MSDDLIDYVFGGVAPSGAKTPLEHLESGNGKGLYSLVDLGPREPRRYRLLLQDEQLISSRSADNVQTHLLYHILTRMREQTEEYLLIHAGSVVTPGGDGVLLPADAGAGKTTLVAGLIRAGFGFLSDEIGVIDHRAGVVRPYPRALNFKEGSRAIFPELENRSDGPAAVVGDGYLRAEAIRADALAGPSKLRFVIAPRYKEGAATEVIPLSTGATVKELWANAMNIDSYRSKALSILVDLAQAAKGYQLLSGNLEEAVQAVTELTGVAGGNI